MTKLVVAFRNFANAPKGKSETGIFPLNMHSGVMDQLVAFYRLGEKSPYPHQCANVVKRKVHPTTGHEDPEGEYMYSFTLSLTSALDWVRGERHAPAALPP